jgi:hypothetical protein
MCLWGVVVLGLFASARAAGGEPDAALAERPNGHSGAARPPSLKLGAKTSTPSRDGTFSLEWGVPPKAQLGGAPREYHVQIAAPPEPGAFLDWYRGPAVQSFVSGIPSGEARVRVRARPGGERAWGPWSETLVVPVEHHAMEKAFGLMGVGFLVFSAVSGFVGLMAWRTREEGRA